MNDSGELTPTEERIEEIRTIRRRRYGPTGTDYAKLREMGNRLPPGRRCLEGVQPVTPLSVQLAEGNAKPEGCR